MAIVSKMTEEFGDCLFSDTDPDIVKVNNEGGKAPVLVTCDHASNFIPESLANLGLDQDQLHRHIAYDIGALNLATMLAEKLDAPMIQSGYSRLIIDPNRHLDDPSLIPIVSEGTPVPGNQNLDADAINARVNELFWPYHQRFSQLLDHFQRRDVHPVILAVHTFTPVYLDVVRPWHTGVMWHHDDRISAPFLNSLNERGDIVVGDNQPYTAIDPVGYAFDVHARKRGLPNLFLEVRQDLVADEAGVNRWSDIILNALNPLLEDQHLYSILEDE